MKESKEGGCKCGRVVSGKWREVVWEICEWGEWGLRRVVVYEEGGYVGIWDEVLGMVGDICEGLLEVRREVDVVFVKVFEEWGGLVIEVV